MRRTRMIGLAFAATLAVAVVGMSYQSQSRPDAKTDVRMTKGALPGGVTLVGSNEATPLRSDLEIATFGGG